jgi:hypothetical protein
MINNIIFSGCLNPIALGISSHITIEKYVISHIMITIETSFAYHHRLINCSRKIVKSSANTTPPTVQEIIHIKVIHTCIDERYFSGSFIYLSTIFALSFPLFKLSIIFNLFDQIKTISDNAKKEFNKIRKNNIPISIYRIKYIKSITIF